ncbi:MULTISPECIES: hypothetical protein [Nocardia]|uniref:hypothetical protein n=1 Tax=Nocardia TaxID=1817 RepID=UPI0007A4BB20|nr:MULTISPECIES: hypothetical protein [Nocardia]MBF6276390.1 hypothetical protein [Nocardia nova]OBA46003.1 hypothetical protein A5789_05830 [Nocardia sp. 852002-51101_SCH5132738]OBB38588.1 hypothetical protein A5748_02735 [Nocardia sp. 852002-51244_SCH5132740]OBF82936.1 hypothetical protein A9X06_18390 [Mycobacterium sp. 852002-51759_SCH5129042]
MATEENGFLEYLQLQGSDKLVTKSELIAAVRQSGLRLTSRQLTFYATTAGLVPHSVRVGSRAGAYPAIVVDLMKWILRARKVGVSIEALKELLPLWKYLIQARSAGVVDLKELEYIARQHVESSEGAINVPRLVIDTLGQLPERAVEIVDKDGRRRRSIEPETTVGFAIARRQADEEGGDGDPNWFVVTRITLALPPNYSTDPTTVILGLKPNEKLPPDPDDQTVETSVAAKQEEVSN